MSVRNCIRKGQARHFTGSLRFGSRWFSLYGPGEHDRTGACLQILVLLILALAPMCMRAQPSPALITVHAGDVQLLLRPSGSRFHFKLGDTEPFKADADAGLLLNGTPVNLKVGGHCDAGACTLRGTNADGAYLYLTVTLRPHHAVLTATPEQPGAQIRFVTGGAAPAYALSPPGEGASSAIPPNIAGLPDMSAQGAAAAPGKELAGKLLYYPAQHFAETMIEPSGGTADDAVVATSAERIVQGVGPEQLVSRSDRKARAAQPVTANGRVSVALHYFFGDLNQIAQAYRDAERAAGRP